MGDINLLGMIRKIKNSLSGFVSTSDKATKSKFGIVKIGEGINVASGVISVAGGGGFTADTLWTEGGTPTALAKNVTLTLAHNYSDYKILSITLRRGSDGCTTCFYDATITMKQLIPYVDASGNWALCGTSFSSESPTTLTIADASNTTNMYIHKVVGYK